MLAMHEEKQHGKLTFPYTVYGGRVPEWLSEFPLHWHDEMEIIHVIEGSMTVSIQNEEILVSEGDMVFIQPQFIHSICQHGDDKAKYYNILFRFSLLETNERDPCYEKYFLPVYSSHLIIPKYLSRDNPLNGKITPFVQQLTDLRRHSEDGIELIIKSCLFGIMHYICAESKPKNAQDNYIEDLYTKLKRSLELVENRYDENLTVEEAARVSNFSASHFSKMFRQLTGTSFNQYLKNYRLEIASKKLRQESMTVSRTAIECGFNNLSYFTRAFKKKYGITPYSYKNG